MEKLDYDFDRVRTKPSESVSIAVRTLNFDNWVSSFLSRHENAIILHLGCGLDSRAKRLDWGGNVSWLDIDLPEVVELRKRVMPTSFQGMDYKILGIDITKDGWLNGLPRDKPVAVVMEGLISYLPREEVRGLLKNIVKYFDGGEVFFDCISENILKALNAGHLKAVASTGAQFQSSIDDLQDLESIEESLKVIEAVPFILAPGIEKLPLGTRFQMYIASWVPKARDGVRLVRMGFGNLKV